jgi:predicted MFS family arabinose efflux permease
MQNNTKPEKLLNKSYIFLILVSFIIAMGFSMVMTMIVDYSKNSLGASLSIAGILSGIFSISALCIRPFSGIAVDRFNKKTICIVASSAIGLACFGYAIAPNVPTLLAFRILHGVAFGISSTANIALVSKFIPKGRMGEGLGYYGLGQVFAQAIGPNIGVVIENAYGYKNLFYLITAITFVGVFMLFQFKYTVADNELPQAQKKGKIISLHNMIAKEALAFAIVGGVFSFGNGVVNSFLKLLADERGITGYALYFTISAFVLFGMRIIIGRVVDKQGLNLIVNVSLFASFLSMLFLGFAQALPLILASAFLKSFGQGGGQISLQAECIKKVDPSRIGVATSTYFIGADIGQGIGPIVGGAIAAAYSYKSLYIFTAVLFVLAMVAFNIYQKITTKPN